MFRLVSLMLELRAISLCVPASGFSFLIKLGFLVGHRRLAGFACCVRWCELRILTVYASAEVNERQVSVLSVSEIVNECRVVEIVSELTIRKK